MTGCNAEQKVGKRRKQRSFSDIEEEKCSTLEKKYVGQTVRANYGRIIELDELLFFPTKNGVEFRT